MYISGVISQSNSAEFPLIVPMMFIGLSHFIKSVCTNALRMSTIATSLPCMISIVVVVQTASVCDNGEDASYLGV